MFRLRQHQGAISIFLVIILLPVMAVSGVMIDASRYQLGKALAQSAGDLTLNTALTQYDTVVKDVYGLFALSQNNQELMENLEIYFKDSLASSGINGAAADDYVGELIEYVKSTGLQETGRVSDLLQATVVDFSVEGIPNSSLANPAVLRKQIVEFMKYRAPMNAGIGFLESLKAFQGMKEKKEVMDKKMTYYEQQATVSSTCYELYKNLKDFEDLNINPKDSDQYLLKQKTDINQEVYQSIVNEYFVGMMYQYKNDALLSQPFYLFSGTSVTPALTFTVSTRSTAKTNFENNLNLYNNAAVVQELNSVDQTNADPIQFLMQYNNYEGSGLNDGTSDGYQRYAYTVYKHYFSYESAKNTDIQTLQNDISTLEQYNSDNSSTTDAAIKLKIEENKTTIEQKNTDITTIETEFNGVKSVLDSFTAKVTPVSTHANKIYMTMYGGKSWSDWVSACKTKFTGASTPTYQNTLIGLTDIYAFTSQKYADVLSAIEDLTSAQTNIDLVITEIKKLETAQTALSNAVNDPSLPNDSFKETSQSEFQKLAEIFKLSDIEVLKERINNTKTYVEAIKKAYEETTYLGKPIHELNDLNALRQASDGKKQPSTFVGTAYNIEHPPVQKDELKRFKDDYFKEYFKTSTFDYATPFLKDPNELPFYRYLFATYSGQQNDTAKADFKDVRNNYVQTNESSVTTSVDAKNGAGNSSSGVVYTTKNIETAPVEGMSNWVLPSSGSNSALAGGKEENTKTSTNDADDPRDDNSKQTLSNSTSFVTDFFSSLENAMLNARDNLFVMEYCMSNFSYSTMLAEARYDSLIAAGNKKPSLSMVKGIAIDDTIKAIPKTLTGVDINQDNNYAFGAEVEYFVFGNKQTDANVLTAYASIFGIRMMLNTIFAFTSPIIRNDTFTVAVPISAATLGVFPVPLVQAVLQIGIALAETGVDMVLLKEGMPVPIYKTKETWQISSYNALQKAKEATADIAKDIASKGLDFAESKLNELLDEADEKLTAIGEDAADELGDEVENIINNQFSEITGSVVNKLTDLCTTEVAKMQSMMADEIDIQSIVTSIEEELQAFANDPNDNDVVQAIKKAALDAIIQNEYVEQLLNSLSKVLYNKEEDMRTEIEAAFTDLMDSIAVKINSYLQAAIMKAGSVLKQYKDEAVASIKDSIKDGKEKLKETINQQLGKLSGTSNTSIQSAASSLFSFRYSDYLKLFLFLGVSFSGEGTTTRIADIIQCNMATSKNFNHSQGNGFRMKNAYTYVNIQSKVAIKPMLITMPFIAELSNSDTTPTGGQENNWYDYNYSGIAGY